MAGTIVSRGVGGARSEEQTSELQSLAYLVCRLLLEKKNVELRSTNLDQLSQRRVKLDRSIERRHRAIGVERQGLQIDTLILHRITCYSSGQRARHRG